MEGAKAGALEGADQMSQQIHCEATETSDGDVTPTCKDLDLGIQTTKRYKFLCCNAYYTLLTLSIQVGLTTS